MDLARNIRCFFLIICWGRPVATGFLLTSGEWARHAWPPRHMSADNRHFHFASTFCVIVGRAVLVVCEGNLDKSDDERNRKRWRRSKCLRTGEQKKNTSFSHPCRSSYLFFFSSSPSHPKFEKLFSGALLLRRRSLSQRPGLDIETLPFWCRLTTTKHWSYCQHSLAQFLPRSLQLLMIEIGINHIRHLPTMRIHSTFLLKE